MRGKVQRICHFTSEPQRHYSKRGTRDKDLVKYNKMGPEYHHKNVYFSLQKCLDRAAFVLQGFPFHILDKSYLSGRDFCLQKKIVGFCL